MRKISLVPILLLATYALAQDPLAVSVTGNSITFTNAGAKEVISIFATASVTRGAFDYTHDYFAQSHGLMTGASVSTDTPSPASNVKVIYVQFADGTVWGDTSLTAAISSNRKKVAAMYQDLLLSYETGGEQSFLAELAKYETGITQEQHLPSNPKATANMTHMYYKQYGITQTIAKLKGRVAAANARWSTGNF